MSSLKIRKNKDVLPLHGLLPNKILVNYFGYIDDFDYFYRDYLYFYKSYALKKAHVIAINPNCHLISTYHTIHQNFQMNQKNHKAHLFSFYEILKPSQHCYQENNF